MTIAFVHGNPETAAVWDLVAARLAEAGFDEQVRLSPPGFGAPVPEAFAPTPDAYRDWLIGELEALGRPVHLVGHDWGGVHVVNVAMARPDLLRSWVSDAIGVLDPDYVWHDLAKLWQTPGAGEAWVAEQLQRTPQERAELLAARGMDERVAARVAEGYDAAMGDCVLRLYRAAGQPYLASLGAGLQAASARPGLCVLPTEDHFVGTEEQRRRCAERAGAEVATLEGRGHWWITEDDGRPAAQALAGFFANVPAGAGR
jgi:pimeloyl-ACP methyl ester carboxylesterase